MPLKTKRKSYFSHPDEKPGLGKQHILDVYSQTPSDPETLLNGHVLYIYIVDCQRSKVQTERKILQLVEESDIVLPQINLSYHLKKEIKKLVDNSLNRYRCLSDSQTFQKFCSVCQEDFHLLPTTDIDSTAVCPIQGIPPSEAAKPDSPKVQPTHLHSPIKTRQLAKCTTCKTMRKNMMDMKRRIQLKEKSVQSCQSLIQCALKSKNISIKRLNQKLKRKESRLIDLKQKLSSVSPVKKLKLATKNLNRLKKKNTQIKNYHRSQKSFLSPTSCEDTDESFIKDLKEELKGKEEEITLMENEKSIIIEKIKELENQNIATKSNSKTYSPNMRMMVYEAIVNQVPTANIPSLIKNFARRLKVTVETVPHRSTVDHMARELGILCDYQAAEALYTNEHCTLGFDATTQEHTHVNEIHFTTDNQCFSIALDAIPGGTARDYFFHITESIDNLAHVYAHFDSKDFQETRMKMIDNVTNTLTDRCAANHATVRLLNTEWDKCLNELNCNLHPLDSVATKVRSAIKNYERSHNISKKLLGSDCIIGDLVLQINKMRYKNSKGDPLGFVIFLEDHGLQKSILPRYRGNRLHIFFHICGILFQHYLIFKEFFEKGTSCGGLRQSIFVDFSQELTNIEMQVVGLIGKLLTGPWMTKFYTSEADQIDHVDSISCVKEVIRQIKRQIDTPNNAIHAQTDFFGQELSLDDRTLQMLKMPPKDQHIFSEIMKACLEACVNVLERQYQKYFEIDITEQLKAETKSAKLHNIDSEQMMGMFSAAQKKAPHATLSYISCKLRAQKNKTIEYLDELCDEKREEMLKRVVIYRKKQTQKVRLRQKDLMVELSKRQADKRQARDTAARKKLEKKLKLTTLDDIKIEFDELNDEKLDNLYELMSGNAIGRDIGHIWYEEGQLVLYKGKIKKLHGRGKRKMYEVAYWDESSTIEEAVDYDMSIAALAADLVMDDLIM